MVDGRAVQQYESHGTGDLEFSPDGKCVAYVTPRGAGVMVRVNGQDGPRYDKIRDRSLVVRADGGVEYMAIKDKCLYAVEYLPGH